MVDVPFALAFTSGMIVTVNPCGFAMLPAYLSFFVGDREQTDRVSAIARALVVGPTVTVGFVGAFAVLGLLVTQLSSSVYDVTPWLSVVIGVALVLFGFAFVLGFEVRMPLPHLDRGGRTQSLGSIVMFGVSYAVASVGCTLPLFIAAMTGTFGRGLASGVAYYFAYALGFGLMITTVTVAIAMAKGSIVLRLRAVLPFVQRIAGVLLVVTGLYIAHYGWVAIVQGRSRAIPESPFVDQVTRWSFDVQSWIVERQDVLPWLLLSIVATAAGVTWLVQGRSRRTVRQ